MYIERPFRYLDVDPQTKVCLDRCVSNNAVCPKNKNLHNVFFLLCDVKKINK